MKKRLLSAILVVALVLSMTACGNSNSSESANENSSTVDNSSTAETADDAEEVILHYGIGVAPSGIDPTNLQEIVSYEMVRQCYNGLTDREESGALKPGLAESWDTPDQGKTWHFVLRQGVKFHSGKELTAEDVKFTFEYDLDPERASSSVGSLLNIKGAAEI